MPRTILVHLNVALPDGLESRSPDELADAIMAAIEVGSESDDFRIMMGFSLADGDLASGNDAPIVCTLAEEI